MIVAKFSYINYCTVDYLTDHTNVIGITGDIYDLSMDDVKELIYQYVRSEEVFISDEEFQYIIDTLIQNAFSANGEDDHDECLFWFRVSQA